MKELTQKELISRGCDVLGITMKDMCEELNLNYKSFMSTIIREPLSGSKYFKIAKYLNLDLMELMGAPFDKPRSEEQKRKRKMKNK